MNNRWRRAPKLDTNQTEVVEALELSGAKVLSLARVSDGCPDLLVAARGFLFFVEVKRAAGPKGGTAGRHLTPVQERFHAKWREYIFIVTTPAEAVDVVNGVSRVVELEG